MVIGRPVPANVECRAKCAESGREHRAGTVGIWQVLRKEVARASCQAVPRACPEPAEGASRPRRGGSTLNVAETTRPPFASAPHAVRSTAPAESEPHADTSADD